MVKFFELNKKYQFDINDLTSAIFLVAAVLGMTNGNPTPFFAVGSAIGFATCFKARRINLIILNGSLLALNIFNILA
jgi:hypothetical protein